MVRKFGLLVLACLSGLFGKDLEQIYLDEGILAVQNAIESNLQSKNYWEKRIGNMDTKYGYYEDDIFLVVVDKKAKNLSLYDYKDGKLTNKFNNEVLTGLMGDKLVEGDLKTPVGVYEITRRFIPSDNYYGPVAFSLSYPNIYDKVKGRTGGGIWIHGFPMNGNMRIDTYKTKGCVAFENDKIIQFDEILKDNGGMVLINENNVTEASSAQIATIFAELFKWKKAWGDSDVKAYLDFYDKEFLRFDGMKFSDFANMKKSIFSKKEDKFIQFTKFSISPYPSTSEGSFFRVSFKEKYRTATYKFDGIKTLYVKLVGDKMKILVEQ
ncbi:L,D-transpeptidase family protein [Campylobacter hyointestinalis]|uniref:L,D-transpeptidase family protein n=1 Tax=Campylobacter hyointestinalis TaxID=198 RepID=UPI00358EA679